MTAFAKVMAGAKGRLVRGLGTVVSQARRNPSAYRPGITVVTVNWNSLPFMELSLRAIRAMSPPSTELLVVDNGSSDGSVEYLRRRSDIRTVELPINFGHGIAVDLVTAKIDTEYLAVLDIDAFPITQTWLDDAVGALNAGAQVAGAHMHRGFVHPCFVVTRTSLLHQYGLTFRPVGSLRRLGPRAPLFLDVGEALSHRVVIRFGGGGALHYYRPTSVRGPGGTGTVYGDLVYHNQYATQGEYREGALEIFREAFMKYHGGPTR